MMNLKSAFSWKIYLGVGGVVLMVLGSGIFWASGRTPRAARAAETENKGRVLAVKFVHPKKGQLERIATQPGSVQAYESVRLFSKVPGFLKALNVDIGERVKKGQPLAIVDVPELEASVLRQDAAVDQAKAKVEQMQARVISAEAERDAAQSAVVQSEAAAKSAAAWVRYRTLQHKRMKELYAARSIEEKLVDESKERLEASVETEVSAQAAIVTAKAKVVAAKAKIDANRADVAEAQSQVRLAKAELTKAEVLVNFATISAPFDGVVTHRNLFKGDFVRSAEGGGHEPLLVVQRTDIMRVIVQIPDRDVIFADKGDTALVDIHALAGKRIQARIDRIAHSEDAQTRLMHVEIDLPNPSGKICHGMYGDVTIVLDKAIDQFSIPSSCLVGKAQDGLGQVYIVRDGHARLAKVRLGVDNGLRVAVLEGLTDNDKVVIQPGNALTEGAAVAPSALTDEGASASH